MFGHRFFASAFYGPRYFGPAGGAVTPPTTPSTAYPAKRRYEVQRKNGQIISVETEADLERMLREIKAEAPKKKRSRKIKRAFEVESLPDPTWNDMGALFAIMAEQNSRMITEAALMALATDMLLQRAIDEEEAILLLLA